MMRGHCAVSSQQAAQYRFAPPSFCQKCQALPLELTVPISRNFQVYVPSNEAFHDAAEKLIGIAFDLQNQRGRYLKEWNYQLAMQGRIEAAGLGEAIREGEIVLSFQMFQKTLFIDLLFDSMLLLEIKATRGLCPAMKLSFCNI